MTKTLTLLEAKKRVETFCTYQERCHKEVVSKLWDLGQKQNEIDEIVSYLIIQNFLNEERFACSFARGKHRIKSWGKTRIINELKFKHISSRNITTALREISEEEYQETFEKLSSKIWDNIQEREVQKKRKKFCDYLLRKGWESNWVYEKAKFLEK